jgi:hypothetical protein
MTRRLAEDAPGAIDGLKVARSRRDGVKYIMADDRGC